MTIALTRANLRLMRKAIQGDLFPPKSEHGPRRIEHGGGLRKGKRKIRRPFKRNVPIHLTLKSSMATGKYSMLSPKNRLEIERTVEKQLKGQNGKIHARQNVGNHYHMLVSFKTKLALSKFLKAVAGLIARHIFGSKKGRAAHAKFWDHVPHSRITQGFKDFQNVVRYVLKNTVEAELGKHFREGIERFDRAQAKALKSGRPIEEFL